MKKRTLGDSFGYQPGFFLCKRILCFVYCVSVFHQFKLIHQTTCHIYILIFVYKDRFCAIFLQEGLGCVHTQDEAGGGEAVGKVALAADDGDGGEAIPDRVSGLGIQDVVVAGSVFYEIFLVIAGGGQELIGIQGDGSKVVPLGIPGIGEGNFPGRAVGLFAVGHNAAAAQVQDHA